MAEEVAGGRADAGFGLRADATRHKLAFTPLAMERYFFACAKAALPRRGDEIAGRNAPAPGFRGARVAAPRL